VFFFDLTVKRDGGILCAIDNEAIFRAFPFHAPPCTLAILSPTLSLGAVVQLVEYRTRNREVAGSTHTRSTASNLEQVAKANSASYPQRDGK